MSLLLDALKKAALEKQRREQSEKNTSDQAGPDAAPHNVKPSVAPVIPAAENTEITEDKVSHHSLQITEDLAESQASLEIEAEAEFLDIDLDEVERNYQLVSEEKNQMEFIKNDVTQAITANPRPTDNLQSHQPDIESTTTISFAQEIPPQETNAISTSTERAKIISEHSTSSSAQDASSSDSSETLIEKNKPLIISESAPPTAAPLQVTEYSPEKSHKQENPPKETPLKDDLPKESPEKKEFNTKDTKDSLYTLLSSSHKAAKAAQKRMILACVALVVISICLVGVYYYLLDSHPLTPQQPESSNLAATPLSEESLELVIEPENQDAANEILSLDTDTSDETNLANETLENPTVKASTEKPVSHSKELPPQKQLTNKEKSYSFPAEKSQAQVIETTQVNHDDLIVDPVYAGYKAYMAGDFPAAEAAYRAALVENPNRRDALLGAAAVAVQQNRYEDALRFYQQQLSRFPKDEYAQAGILSLSINNSDNPLFDSELNNLLRTYPNAAHLHFLKGSLCASRQQWAAAQISFFEAWRRDTQNPDYAFNLAVALDHIQEPQEAIKFYQKALSSSKDYKVGFSIEAAQERLKALEKQHK
jgi:tetratricopeptide (TPR) repeat protein